MKMKTYKAFTKRFKLTKKKKLIKRKAGQDHFNSRENGKTRRNKRSDVKITAGFSKKALDSLMPYKK
ncbi:hypothetical protein HON52_04955 [Candidatus Uhrbacteria bacterium]|jgi:ribosomal protein L35|nr:hypothetical protein [Candidatus Uhrbacteria bacterium]